MRLSTRNLPRAISQENKELKATTKVQIEREEAEQTYKKFAREC